MTIWRQVENLRIFNEKIEQYINVDVQLTDQNKEAVSDNVYYLEEQEETTKTTSLRTTRKTTKTTSTTTTTTTTTSTTITTTTKVINNYFTKTHENENNDEDYSEEEEEEINEFGTSGNYLNEGGIDEDINNERNTHNNKIFNMHKKKNKGNEEEDLVAEDEYYNYDNDDYNENRKLNEDSNISLKLYDEYEDYVEENNPQKINLETHLRIKNEKKSEEDELRDKILYPKSSSSSIHSLFFFLLYNYMIAFFYTFLKIVIN